MVAAGVGVADQTPEADVAIVIPITTMHVPPRWERRLLNWCVCVCFFVSVGEEGHCHSPERFDHKRPNSFVEQNTKFFTSIPCQCCYSFTADTYLLAANAADVASIAPTSQLRTSAVLLMVMDN
jgi:hypothetical protein